MYREKIDALMGFQNIAFISTMAVEYETSRPQFCVKDAEDLIKTVDIIARTKAFSYIAIDNVLGCIENSKYNDYDFIKNVYLALSTISKENNVVIFT